MYVGKGEEVRRPPQRGAHPPGVVRKGGEDGAEVLTSVLEPCSSRVEPETTCQRQVEGSVGSSVPLGQEAIHRDKDYSFTDCTSFAVMRELRLREALTTDRHFRQAGFGVLPGRG